MTRMQLNTAIVLAVAVTLAACASGSDGPREPTDSTGGADTGAAVTGTPPSTISASGSASADSESGGDASDGTTAAVTATSGETTAALDGTTTTANTDGTGSGTGTNTDTDGPDTGTGTGTGTSTGSESSSDTGPEQTAGLVINEVGYNDPGADTDGQEFVEIYNGSGNDITLAGLELYFVNGSNASPYAPGNPIDLSDAGDTLPDGGYLVIADSPATLGIMTGPNLLAISLGGAGNVLQNGSPDGLVLYDTDADVALDSVVWEGAPFIATDIDGQINVISVGEGAGVGPTDAALVNGDSIGRDSDSTDTDDTALDFAAIAVGSPGAAN